MGSVVAQLTEWSLLTSEVHRSNPKIFIHNVGVLLSVKKTKIKNDAVIGPFIKRQFFTK